MNIMRAGDRPGLFSVYFCVCLLSLFYIFPTTTPTAQASPGLVISRYDEFPSLNLGLDNDHHNQHRHALLQQQHVQQLEEDDDEKEQQRWVPQHAQEYAVDAQLYIPPAQQPGHPSSDDNVVAFPTPPSDKDVVAAPPASPVATKKYKRFVDDAPPGDRIMMPDKYVANGLALISTLDGSLHCIHKKDGSILWTRPPAASGAAVSYRYPASSSEEVAADLDVYNGDGSSHNSGGSSSSGSSQPSRDDWTFIVEPAEAAKLYLFADKLLRPIATLSQLVESSPMILAGGTWMSANKSTGLMELFVESGEIASNISAGGEACTNPEDGHARPHEAHLGSQVTVLVGTAEYHIVIVDPKRNKKWDISYTEFIAPKEQAILPRSKTWIGNVKSDFKTINIWYDDREQFGWQRMLNSSTTAVFDVYKSSTNQRAILARQQVRPLHGLQRTQPSSPKVYIDVYAGQPYIVSKENVPLETSLTFSPAGDLDSEKVCHSGLSDFPSCLKGFMDIDNSDGGYRFPGLPSPQLPASTPGGQNQDSHQNSHDGDGKDKGHSGKLRHKPSTIDGRHKGHIDDFTSQKPSTATTVIGWLVILSAVLLTIIYNKGPNYITKPVDTFLEENRIGIRINDVARAVRRGAQAIGISSTNPTLPLSSSNHSGSDTTPLLEQDESAGKGRDASTVTTSTTQNGQLVEDGDQLNEKEKPGGKPHGRRKKRGRGGKGAKGAVAAASNGDGDDNVESGSAEKAALKQETLDGGYRADQESEQVTKPKDGDDGAQPRRSTDSERTQELPNSAGSTNTTTSTTTAVAPPLKSITVSDAVLGYGSHGTVVYKGNFEGRQVAVKRMLIDFYDVAYQEVKLLQESDDHPNVVRYFRSEQCDRFLYIALELCAGSLDDVIERGHQQPYRDLLATFSPQRILYQIISGIHHLHSLKIVHRDIKPQNILIAEPRRRLKHSSSSSSGSSFGSKSSGAHSLPQLGGSGMITGVVRANTPPAVEMHPGRVMISDFGLCRKLENDQSSFHNTTMHGGHIGRGGGTIGWRAPECFSTLDHESSDDQLERMVDGMMPGIGAEDDESNHSSSKSGSGGRNGSNSGRMTRAIDVFSAGCVFYYVLTNGDHPFGDRYSRERNILLNRPDLSGLDALGTEGIEAKDLISKMINRDPRDRPDAWTVMHHPFFWSASKRLLFMQDCSDRFEIEDRVEGREGQVTPLLAKLEHNAKEILGKDWYKVIDRVLVDNLGRYRKYDGNSVRDLLRALRNKKHHYQDLPAHVKRALGDLPDGFLNYFTSRFPKLMLHLYYLVANDPELRNEGIFRHYFSD